MKIKNRLFLLGAAMAVMSSSAFADTMGTQTFTANVTADTCTIANLNQVIDVGAVLKNDPALKKVSERAVAVFNVTGCDASVTKAVMIPNFDALPGYEAGGYAKNKGTAVIDARFAQKTVGATNENTQPDWLAPGKKVSVPLVNGATQFDIGFSLNASSYDLSKIKVGTLDYPLTLTFDFV
ncbi:type 1 fimbrial protein [Salmonella enterica subsp. enterica serovar Muenchen]|nr:type 1 fimbrial protein [Salmonella enterica subsp. enterica serovar Muenchen]